jgi:hypothetical protein
MMDHVDEPRTPHFHERLIAALRLDVDLYRQASIDMASTRQAFLVVVLSGLSNGLGLAWRQGSAAVSAGIAAAVFGWFLWAAVILMIALPFGHRRHGRSLLRALGFANAPGILLVLGVVPVIGRFIRMLIVLWLVATTVAAVQAVFEMSRRRALVVSIVGFVAYLVIGAVSGYFAAS